MQNRYMLSGLVRGVVRPCVNPLRRGMPDQIKHFDNALPNCLPLERLFHLHALNMRSFSAVQFPNHILEFLDISSRVHGAPTTHGLHEHSPWIANAPMTTHAAIKRHGIT